LPDEDKWNLIEFLKTLTLESEQKIHYCLNPDPKKDYDDDPKSIDVAKLQECVKSSAKTGNR
jgi:hypothetical protein